MFRIEMLPAEYGDALWIEYGDAAAPHRVLVDCGTASVFGAIEERIGAMQGKREFELFVVTHVDIDHIGGAVRLLEECRELGVGFGEVWFNGYKHLEEAADILGPVDGERLTELLVEQELAWNTAFGREAVMVPAEGALPERTLPGGMKLALLSPYAEQLVALKPVWEEAVRQAHLVPGGELDTDEEEEGDDILGKVDMEELLKIRFREDPKEANGSSIAFIAEYGGKRLLCGADAHPSVLLRSLARLGGAGPIQLDALKVSHHGSAANTSRQLMEALRCPNYLISTNGKRYRHPSQAAIARIIEFGRGPTLHFNYRTSFNEPWDDAALRQKHKYKTRYPDHQGIGVELG